MIDEFDKDGDGNAREFNGKDAAPATINQSHGQKNNRRKLRV